MAGDDKPTLTIIAGPNGSGKSTLVNAMQADGYDFGPVVNPDVIAAGLPAGTPNPDREAGKRASGEIKKHLAERRSFAQETTLAANQPVKLMQDAKEAGYHVNVLYVGIEALSLSSRRVAARVAQGGHNIPLSDQERRFARSLEKLKRAAEIADNVVLLDNSVTERAYRLTADIEQGTVKHLDGPTPKWTRQAVADLPQASNPSRQLSSFGERVAESATNARGSITPQPDQAQPGHDQAKDAQTVEQRIQARMQQLDGRAAAATRSRGGPER